MGLIAALLLILGFIFYLWWTNRVKGAPYIPMEADVAGRIVKLAKIDSDDTFYDLGSGDGRLVIAAAMKGARSYGVELDKLRVWYSRIWIRLLRLSNKATIIHKDIFETNLSNATVVCTYLLQETNDRLQKKLQEELKPGTRVVSLAFSFKNWIPKKIDRKGNRYGPIYYYEI